MLSIHERLLLWCYLTKNLHENGVCHVAKCQNACPSRSRHDKHDGDGHKEQDDGKKREIDAALGHDGEVADEGQLGGDHGRAENGGQESARHHGAHRADFAAQHNEERVELGLRARKNQSKWV